MWPVYGANAKGEKTMWEIILTAIALVLIIEGFTPFISPKHYRKMMEAMTKCSDKALRIMGLIAMVIGVIIMYLVHSGVL